MIAPTLTIERLVYHYEESIPALNGVDLAIAGGAFMAIVGQNGSGKTTLVKHLNGLLRPTSGRVLVGAVDTRAATVGELARTVGYVFQNPDHQIFAPTVRQEVAFGPHNLGLPADACAERVDEALVLFGLTAHAELPPAVLGFGLRRLVSIAAVYAMRPSVLILDEPTAGLDWRSATQLLGLMQHLHHQGHTILLVTHDMRLVANYAPQTLVMHEGRALALGATQQVLALREQLALAQIEPPQMVALGQQLGLEPAPLTVAAFAEAYLAARGSRP